MAQWYENERGQARLALEDAAMRRFHGAVVLRQTKSGALYFRGPLTTSISGTTYTVEILFDQRHPDVVPQVRVVDPLPEERNVPHRYGNGQLCLFRPGDGPSAGYAADATTAATLVGWAAAWLHAYEIWQRTGHWPGPDGHR